MRERKTWLVVTFHTTAAAIGMEKLCTARGLAGRLIPVPRALTADCGMAWRAEIDRRAALEALAAGEGWRSRALRADAVKKQTHRKQDGNIIGKTDDITVFFG